MPHRLLHLIELMEVIDLRQLPTSQGRYKRYVHQNVRPDQTFKREDYPFVYYPQLASIALDAVEKIVSRNTENATMNLWAI